MLDHPQKSILVNDKNPINKINKKKKRLIIKSTTVLYSFDTQNKKKIKNKRRSLSQIILPGYEKSTNEIENNFINISMEKINESNTKSNSNTLNISNIDKNKNEKKLINEILSFHNNYKVKNKNKKINKSSSWRGTVINLENLLIEKVRNIKEDSIKGIYDINKIILIQSFYRRYNCRKNIYNKLMSFYKQNAASQKLYNILFLYIHKLFNNVINDIKEFRKHKYYISKKEYKLLIELHNKNIFNVKDLINYFSNLFKQFNININNNNFSKNNKNNNINNIENNNQSKNKNVSNKNESLSLSNDISLELNNITINSFNTENSIYK